MISVFVSSGKMLHVRMPNFHASKSPPGRQRLIALPVILPLWTSILVRSYAWIVLLGRGRRVAMSW